MQSAKPATRILVVEDETIIALDIEQQLRNLGYQPLGFVTTGEEALLQCEELVPDVVLMDIQLAGSVDGIAAAQLIRQQNNLPVVMLTAYSSDDILLRAKIAEPFGYVLKPFSTDELRIAIEMALYKHRTETRLRISDQALHSISQGVLIFDAQHQLCLINTAFTAITGYTKEDISSHEWQFLTASNADPAALQALLQAQQSLLHATGEILCQRKDGSLFWNEMTINSILDKRGQMTHQIYVIRDVSARKHALDQLRELSSRQMQIKENEHKQIAREIHDDLGSLLYGIQSCLSVLSDYSPSADPTLKQATEMASTAIDTMRKMITKLRPSVLDHLGVWAALEWYCGQMAQRTELSCDYLIDPEIEEIEVKPDAATAIFRIAQELLSNVLRHAKANEVEVQVSRAGPNVCITVADNGVGISNEQIMSEDSWGIIGMYERAHSFQGDLKLRRQENAGTLATLQLPLEIIHAN